MVISHQMWLDSLGADPNVLGQQLKLNSGAYTVIGVMGAAVSVSGATSSTVDAGIAE